MRSDFLHKSVNKNCCVGHFPMSIPFISFYFIALAKTSGTTLKRSSERGHSCLVPVLSGNASSFSPVRIVLAAGFLVAVLYKVKGIPLCS